MTLDFLSRVPLLSTKITGPQLLGLRELWAGVTRLSTLTSGIFSCTMWWQMVVTLKPIASLDNLSDLLTKPLAALWTKMLADLILRSV